MNPFNQTCVGLETAHNYVIELNLIKIDFWKVILLGIALFVFFSAKKLSQTPVFYYLTGIFLGIFASFLVLVYFGSKLFPRVSVNVSGSVSVNAYAVSYSYIILQCRLTFVLLSETNDVRNDGRWLGTRRVFLANASGQCSIDIDDLSKLRGVVYNHNRFHQLRHLLSHGTAEEWTEQRFNQMGPTDCRQHNDILFEPFSWGICGDHNPCIELVLFSKFHSKSRFGFLVGTLLYQI